MGPNAYAFENCFAVSIRVCLMEADSNYGSRLRDYSYDTKLFLSMSNEYSPSNKGKALRDIIYHS